MLTIDVGPRVADRLPAGTAPRPYDRFDLAPLSPTIGAEVDGVDLGGPIDDELQSELRRALLEWKVLFFRDQDLTRDQQRDFALRWGEVEQHPFYKYVNPGQTADDVVTLAKGADAPGFENEWHTDITWHVRPSFGAVLRAVEVPPLGGDTLWSDTASAHDALPEELQAEIASLVAVHDWRHTFGRGMPREAVEQLSPAFPPVEHPVVRVHPETGRRSIFVNPIFTSHVVGMEPDESDDLLRRLCTEVARPEHQCRFRWSPGAVAFWDNRATQHYASSDYHPQPRVMDRISIAGDVPVGV
ncbi:TauD/TfdA family dioxygenase [Iamia majanohamensis]|uniref:TauD/TfdA family dioxygenase n=1 Tax=Iamia majanohamensis TaxID=467976 RepID=A0AAF0BVH6_9ACTN|nr:TauD/TfdA family dioxygenase [Iamia majanohamensis]WCO66775.1 TauD/TfdA family dioxygenase [Iamia majanohamensis]